ncbi:transcriptional regulator [Candidatus Woesebacteria bacterium]|nr:transcriptional regulator [Candidatus Woesebacteria bacterium]
MAKISQKLRERIRKLRKQRGLTQEALAELARMDPKSVIEIEGGKRNPTLKTVTKVASSLRVKLSQLLD